MWASGRSRSLSARRARVLGNGAPTDGTREEPAPAVNKARNTGGPSTVLYIEDNSSNVQLLEQILHHRPQVSLLIAMQGRSGVEMALTRAPDLILLDLHLPDISGEQVLRRLRADPRTATTPIVILSAHATADQPERLVAMGATSYLTKPIKVPRILELVDQLHTPRSTPPAATTPSGIRHSSEVDRAVGVDTDQPDDDAATQMSTFRHEMTNILGVILTYCDLLASDETKPSKITWLEQQGTATERAIEMTKELRSPPPS